MGAAFYSCSVSSHKGKTEDEQLNAAISHLCNALELMERTDITLDMLRWEVSLGVEVRFYLKEVEEEESDE